MDIINEKMTERNNALKTICLKRIIIIKSIKLISLQYVFYGFINENFFHITSKYLLLLNYYCYLLESNKCH